MRHPGQGKDGGAVDSVLCLCERCVGEGDGDPGRQVELWRVHRTRRPVAATHARHIGGGKERSEQQDRPRLYRLSRRCGGRGKGARSEEHTSELQSLMRISYAVFCLKKINTTAKFKL